MSPLLESDAPDVVPEPARETVDHAHQVDQDNSEAGRDSGPAPDAFEIAESVAFVSETVSPATAEDKLESAIEAETSPATADPSGMRFDGAGDGPFSLPGATVSGLMTAVHSLEDSVGRKLDLLQKSFDRELRAEANRERVVERLHSELQDYKQDLLLKVQRPIFIDLIQLHDDIGKMIEASAVPPSQVEATSLMATTLQSVRTAIEDILYRQGVEPFSLEGQTFDPRQQRAISTRATADPALNKQISARVRSGFRAGDKLIRPEIVSVFTYRPSV